MFRTQLSIQLESLRTSFLEKQLADQIDHYESLYKQIYTVHEIRHNVKNILINIDSYLMLGEIDKAHEYINMFQSEVSKDNVVDSGVPLLDAVLTAKKAIFDGDFRLQIVPLKCDYVNLADVGMMLAIALDNAIEGSNGIEKPFVTVSIVQQSRMISIQISNPTLNHPTTTQRFPQSTKSSAVDHGYGLKSCSRLAEKWNGDISWICSNGLFMLDIFIQDIPPAQI